MSKVSLINGHIDGSNTCVICGREIPEGNQVCIICGKVAGKKTNYDLVRNMSLDELAEFLTHGGFDCNECIEHERLSDNPLLKGDACDGECKEHCKQWLKAEVKGNG